LACDVRHYKVPVADSPIDIRPIRRVAIINARCRCDHGCPFDEATMLCGMVDLLHRKAVADR